MFGRLMFVGLVLTVCTLPIGIMATGGIAFVLTGTGTLTLASMGAGLTVRVMRVTR